MSRRTVPLIDERAARRGMPVGSAPEGASAAGGVADRLGRPLHDLRISVTDRCNFRCSYCMPRAVFDQHRFLPHDELLSFEEITRSARLFAALGVSKLRLTGGEPLLRKNLEGLVAQLAALRTPQGEPLDLTLTTNASLLARKAAALKAAGLQRVTVSLDALDDGVFRAMNDADYPVADVLDGIAAAQAAGLGPIKVNMVVKRGVNDGQILPMARHFRGSGVELRFIEYMDVGHTNGWRMDEVLPSQAVRERIAAHWPLQPVPVARAGETARRWAYADGAGSVGFISSVTEAFCGDCSRARLSTDGRIYLCLFAGAGFDLRRLLRSPADDAAIADSIAALWAQRTDRYSELRGAAAPQPADRARRVEMSYIGG